MRTEKFIIKKYACDNDDIQYAFECNDLQHKLHDIDIIVAEVCGANDELPWYWILQMKDGNFSWAYGSCDYTGWDCQSTAEIKEGFSSPEEAIENIELRYESRNGIKECLLKQVKEEIPFAIYQY